MTRKTAIAAPPADPFDDLFVTIDAMSGAEVRRFLAALRERFGLADLSATVTVRVNGVGIGGNPEAMLWMRHLNENGWNLS